MSAGVRSRVPDIKIVISPCLRGSAWTPMRTSACSPKFVTTWTVGVESALNVHALACNRDGTIRKCHNYGGHNDCDKQCYCDNFKESNIFSNSLKKSKILNI